MYSKVYVHVFAVVISVVGIVNGTENADMNGKTVDDPIEAVYSEAYKLIMASTKTPLLKKTAVGKLSALRYESEMICNSTKAEFDDVLEIANQAIDSIDQFITDVNTVVNGVPLCFAGKSFWNFFSIMSCMAGEFKSIWYAISDFWNFDEFYMKTVRLVEAFIECEKNKKKVSKAILKVVSAFNEY